MKQDGPYITSVEKYLSYLESAGKLGNYQAPEIMIICYQNASVEHILKHYPFVKTEGYPSKIYLSIDNKIGVLGGMSTGAPALCIKVEELIAWGVKKIIAVGTSGTLVDSLSIGECVLCEKALAEDGVAHMYLAEGHSFASADPDLMQQWEEFYQSEKASPIKHVAAWSFSNPYRESKQDVRRVKELGCTVVDMEAATLHAIANEKKIPTLSIFVISDSLANDTWTPHFKDPVVHSSLAHLGCVEKFS